MSKTNNYAPYGWIITEDYVSTPEKGKDPTDAGTVGPYNINPEIQDRLEDPLRLGEEGMTKFKMLDADGNLYYVGYIDGEYDLTEPLDDFGTPNAGAIYLKVLEKGGSWSSNVVEAE